MEQLRDYSLTFEQIPILFDNASTINLNQNPIQHFRTKHSEIKHHFIQDHIQRDDIKLNFINSKNQLVDIFTKLLYEEKFYFIKK